MPESEKLVVILDRIKKGREAVAAFSRIADELMVIRKGTPAGRNRDRIDAMLALNKQTLVPIKRSLMIAEEDLGRLQPHAALAPRGPLAIEGDRQVTQDVAGTAEGS